MLNDPVSEMLRNNAIYLLHHHMPNLARVVYETDFFASVLEVRRGEASPKDMEEGPHVLVDFTSRQYEHSRDYGKYCRTLYNNLVRTENQIPI